MIIRHIRSVIRDHIFFFIFYFVLLMLLARNPFGERTLIPNLEPFPDSFHYIVPSMSFLHGRGFVFERQGRTFPPSVPPLYSLYLAPFFAVVSDVRMFYIANVILMVAAYTLFYLIVRKLFSAKVVQAIALFLFVSHPILYWFPTLAMAETLLLVLFLLALHVFLQPVSGRKTMSVAILSLAFYGTKYASLPLAVSFPLLYGAKIIAERRQSFWKLLLVLAGSLLAVGSLYELYEYLLKGTNVVLGLFQLFFSLAQSALPTNSSSNSGQAFFGIHFIRENFPAYTGWLFGQKITMLWRSVAILPPLLAIFAQIGMLLALFQKRTRLFAMSLVAMEMVTILLMSVFYAYDGRYFYIAIPCMFLGFGFFCQGIIDHAQKPETAKRIKIGLVFLLLVLMGWKAKELKFTIALNLKYAETPWYYISVRNLDAYLGSHSIELKKTPVVISSLPPFLIDAYSKQPKILLPLNKGQEFRSYTKQVWGDFDFDNLDGEYERQLRAGHTVLLMKYGLGNEQYLHNDFDRLLQKFDATKVMSGCYDLCDIYELRLQKQE